MTERLGSLEFFLFLGKRGEGRLLLGDYEAKTMLYLRKRR